MTYSVAYFNFNDSKENKITFSAKEQQTSNFSFSVANPDEYKVITVSKVNDRIRLQTTHKEKPYSNFITSLGNYFITSLDKIFTVKDEEDTDTFFTKFREEFITSLNKSFNVKSKNK